ncbi:MAG TPA: hypothetical protein VF933_27525, partial [Streptosporangiaceae bacterium]
MTQQPRVSPNAAAEEAFVPLGGSNGAGSPPSHPGVDDNPPVPRGDERARRDAPAPGREPVPRDAPGPRDGGPAIAQQQARTGVATQVPVRRDGATATAADFTAERYLREATLAPRDGWRRVMYWLSGGRVNFGPSPSELAERELMARAKTRVAGCRSIAV